MKHCSLSNKMNYRVSLQLSVQRFYLFPKHCKHLKPFCTPSYFPLFATSKFYPALCFMQTFNHLSSRSGIHLFCQLFFKGQDDNVTYLRMTLIRPGAAWLSSKEKSRSPLLFFFLASLINLSKPPPLSAEQNEQ